MATRSKKKLRELNDREQVFMELYIENGDYIAAQIGAGYAPHASNARKKAEELHQHIRQALYTKIGSHVPWAINEMVKLATNAKTESVKFNALKDILSRAGYDHALVIESKDAEPEEMSDGEIAQEIQDLVKASGQQLKAVE